MVSREIVQVVDLGDGVKRIYFDCGHSMKRKTSTPMVGEHRRCQSCENRNPLVEDGLAYRNGKRCYQKPSYQGVHRGAGLREAHCGLNAGRWRRA